MLYLVSVFGVYFSVRTVLHAVKFQFLHTVAQISAKCSVFLLQHMLYFYLLITFKWEKIKCPSLFRMVLSWDRIQQEGKVKSKFTLHTLSICMASR